MIRHTMNSNESDQQSSQRHGVIEIPRGPKLIRRPFFNTGVSTPMLGAMNATPTMTFGRSLTAFNLSESPRTVGVLDQAMGTPSRMIQIQHGGTPSALSIPYSPMGDRFQKGHSPEWNPGHVPCNSPIDLTKGNSVRMGIHPAMRGLRHTPESHGWNAFSALVEDVPAEHARLSDVKQPLTKDHKDRSNPQTQPDKS